MSSAGSGRAMISPTLTAAGANALLARQLARRAERLGVADADPIIDQLAVERLGHEVLADALDLPRLRAAPGQHRAFGVGADDADVGVALLEILCHSGKC